MQTVAKFVEKCRDVVVCQKRRFVADGVREVTDEEGDGRAYRTVGQYAVGGVAVHPGASAFTGASVEVGVKTRDEVAGSV